MSTLMQQVRASGDALLEFYDEIKCQGNKMYYYVDDNYQRDDPETLPLFTVYSVKILYIDVAFSGAAIWLYRFSGQLTGGDSYIVPSSSNTGDCFSNGNIGWVHFETTTFTGTKRNAMTDLVQAPDSVQTPYNATEIVERAATRPEGYMSLRHNQLYIVGKPTFSQVQGKPALSVGLFRTIVLSVFYGIEVASGEKDIIPFLIASLSGGTTLTWLSETSEVVPRSVVAFAARWWREFYLDSWKDTMAVSDIYRETKLGSGVWEKIGKMSQAVKTHKGEFEHFRKHQEVGK
ncbi:hypothetical protein N7462_005648 [Penicillium macrosclerotiorum]|uniref:uncharacterized protein n=1 Tax=Penicillium macrosclerotiorum TaxID=303699 RepID=UPI002549A784|nr:uncharacterized protein N7462_005648 [Penicillium macrosclerotiorum]KAJ5682483.1 hypothetical protein N7462_005648 [Penicillium macrosclerotiorum]